MITGVHEAYQWLEVDGELSEFLDLCPHVILGRYVAITAVDSGSFDLRASWTDAKSSLLQVAKIKQSRPSPR